MSNATLWDLPGDKQATDARGAPMKLWWGRAETMQMLLTGEAGYVCNVSTMAKKLFQHSSKCSVLLGRLHDDEAIRGVRLEKKDTNRWKGWLIAPPPVN